MPKTRKAKPRGYAGKSTALRIKFKLGGRKSSTSALSLSNEELLEKYFSPNMPKDRPKILQVLKMRKVEIPESLETENENQ